MAIFRAYGAFFFLLDLMQMLQNLLLDSGSWNNDHVTAVSVIHPQTLNWVGPQM